MHVDENRVHNFTFATKLSAAGYKVGPRPSHCCCVPVSDMGNRSGQVGIFGKYLNSHDLPEQTAVDPGLVACPGGVVALLMCWIRVSRCNIFLRHRFDAWLVNGGGSYNHPFFHASGYPVNAQTYTCPYARMHTHAQTSVYACLHAQASATSCRRSRMDGGMPTPLMAQDVRMHTLIAILKHTTALILILILSNS